MREKTQGARRLANAIWNRSGDPAFIKNLARLLNYEAKQLEEDAEALHDLCAHNPPKNLHGGCNFCKQCIEGPRHSFASSVPIYIGAHCLFDGVAPQSPQEPRNCSELRITKSDAKGQGSRQGDEAKTEPPGGQEDNENETFGTAEQLGKYDTEVMNGLGYYDEGGAFHRYKIPNDEL